MPAIEKEQDYLSEYTTKLTITLIYALLYGIALNFFWRPGNIYAGGITGTSQILVTLIGKWTGIEPSMSLIYYLINIPLLIYGWLRVDKKLVIFTLIGVTFASLSIKIIPVVLILLSVLCLVVQLVDFP